MAERGKFITLEGGEGTGKSTQAKLLAAALEKKGRKTTVTREPGGSPGAEEIRKLLVEGAPERWTPMAETLLFLAARSDHVARLIRPELARGHWVVCDRFSDSTLAYQGKARGLGVDALDELQGIALEGFTPHLTVILDMPVEVGLKRAAERGHHHEGRFERFTKEFHERLRLAFREIAEREPERCVLIDGTLAADEVAASVWRIVQQRLSP
jgi:dTMP kinase